MPAQPGAMQPPPGMPGALPVAAVGSTLGYQFGGAAAISMVFGLISIIVPIAANFYFPILPIFGFINAIRAIQRGRLAGGIVGIVLNLLGGLVSLLASGLIH